MSIISRIFSLLAMFATVVSATYWFSSAKLAQIDRADSEVVAAAQSVSVLFNDDAATWCLVAAVFAALAFFTKK
jgi:hypothetical protein